MRHIATVIAAVVIAPLAWLLIAFGQTETVKAVSAGSYSVGHLVRPLVLLAAAGILVGLIATLRFSPLGAVLAGLAYTASYVLLMVHHGTVDQVLGYTLKIAGEHADLRVPVQNGTSLVLGGLLLVAVVSVKRWRRWPNPEAAEEPTSATIPSQLTPESSSAFDGFSAAAGSTSGSLTGLGGSGDATSTLRWPATEQASSGATKTETAPSSSTSAFSSPWETPPRDDSTGLR
jgi:hypothetical protein